MVVPTDDGSAAETPSGEDPEETAMDQETNAGDIEMDFVGHVGTSQGIGSFEPSFGDMVSELLLAEMDSSGGHAGKTGEKPSRRSSPRSTRRRESLTY